MNGPVIIELNGGQEALGIIDYIIKLLSIFISWPGLFLFIIIYFRKQIREITPKLINRLTSISVFNDLIRLELGIDEVKERARIAVESEQFSQEDKSNIKALIKLLETGDSYEKAYAFDELKDFTISLSKSEQNLVGDQEINPHNLEAYLHVVFPNRTHSEPKYVSEIVGELQAENLKYIKDIDALIKRYPIDRYVTPLDAESGIRSTDVGVIRSLLVARKIDEINEVINSWKPLPPAPVNLRDEVPFLKISRDIASYLIKSGESIKIHTTNVGDLEITNDELGNRIGTGLPYLRRLKERLGSFHEYMLSKTNA